MNIRIKYISTIATVWLYSDCVKQTQAKVACDSDNFCQQLYENNLARCNNDGYCSNPFEKGCLNAMMIDNNQIKNRICNSDDEKIDKSINNCIQSPWNYTEIRIHQSNWESSIFYAWILQIIFMEILDVPVTIGLGGDETINNSFYSPNNNLPYASTAYPFDALKTAHEVGDCRRTTKPCAHVVPDAWSGPKEKISEGVNAGYLDHVIANGQIGNLGWYIPAFTAERDPTLASFRGMQGEKNRHKLAETFLYPLSWSEYCAMKSKDNCTNTDSIAQRYPISSDEKDSYFVPNLYLGHFAYTEKNNCTMHPDTCVGHFPSPTCTWSVNVVSQIHWNNIVGLDATGPLGDPKGSYSYSQLIQIWRAANASKYDLITWWFTPDSNVEEFLGTEAEYQIVTLPTPTQNCAQRRPSSTERCSDNIWERRGDPESGCDQEPHTLHRVLSSNLQYEFLDDEAQRSPAYSVLQSLQISDLEMSDILRKWVMKGQDKYGNDAREAVCSWVVDNIHKLETFFPVGYPREFVNKADYKQPFMDAAQIIGGIASFIILSTAYAIYHYRNNTVLVYAQVNFVYMVLIGGFLRCIAAILVVWSPSFLSCTIFEWLQMIGITIEIAPLILKMDAMQTLFAMAKRMKRAMVAQKIMFQKFFALMILVILYLTLWTIFDPQYVQNKKILMKSAADDNPDRIEVHHSCGSNSPIRLFIAAAWEVSLLIGAAILAYQSRTNTIQKFNESKALCLLAYTHFIFLILRSTIQWLQFQGVIEPAAGAGYFSLLLSIDTILALSIYLAPKFKLVFYPPKLKPSFQSSYVSSLYGSSAHTSMFDPKTLLPDSSDILPNHVTTSNRERSKTDSQYGINIPVMVQAKIPSGRIPSSRMAPLDSDSSGCENSFGIEIVEDDDDSYDDVLVDSDFFHKKDDHVDSSGGGNLLENNLTLSGETSIDLERTIKDDLHITNNCYSSNHSSKALQNKSDSVLYSQSRETIVSCSEWSRVT